MICLMLDPTVDFGGSHEHPTIASIISHMQTYIWGVSPQLSSALVKVKNR